MNRDEKYMRYALQLAEMATGQTSPNPAVGAVLVKDERIVGIGSHLEPGKPHAEIYALQMAGPDARGSTAYVTLEPCAHHGRTPPCADALIRAGVARVVVATEDPFPLVAGKGIAKLRDAGIAVDVGVAGELAARQNAAFLHYARTNMPFVTLKLAATLDGYVATETGDSFYVTGEAARAEVHRLRSLVDAIVVGVETVLKDDPQLTNRHDAGGKQPVRVVFDSRLRTPLYARVIRDKSAKTVLVTTAQAPRERELAFADEGIEVVRTASEAARVKVEDALAELAKRGLISILLEGGSRLAAAFLAKRLVQRVWVFHAPKLLGGGLPALSGLGIDQMAGALELANVEVKTFGRDVLTIGEPVYTN